MLERTSQPSREVDPAIDVEEARMALEALIGEATPPRGPMTIAPGSDTLPESMTREELVKAEVRYRALIEQLPAITFSASLDGGLHELYVSPQIEALLGFSQKEWLENPILWYSQLHPDDRNRWQDEFAQTVMGGSPFRSEYRFLARDGREVWIRGEARVTRDSRGIPLFLQGIAFDITEQKQAEAALIKSREELEVEVQRRTSELLASNISLVQEVKVRQRAENAVRDREARLRSIVETAIDGIILINQRGVVESFNPAAERIFGYPASAVLGQSIGMLMPEPYRSQHAGYLMAYRATGDRKVIGKGRDLVGLRSNGSVFPLELSVSETPTQDGYKYTGIVRDVTDRKRAEAALIEAKLAAEVANQLKGQFLANMSHEIRTPMNGILGMTELALDTRLDPVQREYLETVKLSAESLLLLINDILDFTKIEAGKLDLEPIDFSLREMLDDAVKPLALQIQEKSLRFACEIDAEVPEVLVGDPGRLRQVVINLVSNAVKFTSQGEVVLQVKKLGREDQAEPRLLFVVRDTGIGIPADKHGVIFDSFTQADGSTTRKFGGTGLGLAISRKLVGMMGGVIWVDSEPGQGTTFCFTAVLPRSEKRLQDFAPRNDQLPTATTHHDPPDRPLAILLAEDNPVNQKLAVSLLQKHGHRVTVAENGEIALDLLTDERFDLVIMDVHMPVLDGLAATRMIRDREQTTGEHLPVIALTANAMKGDREECLACGFDEYVTKPIRWPVLREAMHAVLGGVPNRSDTPPMARPSFSRDEALELLGGDSSLMHEVARVFLGECPRLRDDLVEAVAASDSSRVHLAAHSLKGVVANFAAHEATQAALALERMGRRGDLAGADEALSHLEVLLDDLNRDLHALVAAEPQSISP